MSASGIKVTTEKRNGETMRPPAPSWVPQGMDGRVSGATVGRRGDGLVLSGSGKRLKLQEGLCSRRILVGSLRPKPGAVAHASDPSTQEA